MKYPKSASRSKLLLCLLVGATLAAFLGSLIVNPQLQRFRRRCRDLQQLQSRLARMRADLLIKDRIDAFYRRHADMLAGTGPDQQEISRFTSTLNELYLPLDVKIRSVKILPVVQEPFYRKLSLKMEIVAPAPRILRFIAALAALPEPVKVEQCSIHADETPDSLQAAFLITKILAPPAGKNQVSP